MRRRRLATARTSLQNAGRHHEATGNACSGDAVAPCREQGIKRMSLYTDVSISAKTIYEHLGFQPAGALTYRWRRQPKWENQKAADRDRCLRDRRDAAGAKQENRKTPPRESRPKRAYLS